MSGNTINTLIKTIEAIDPNKRTNTNTRNLQTLQRLRNSYTRRVSNEARIANLKQKPNENLTSENKATLDMYNAYAAQEEKRTDRSQCIFNMLSEKEKGEVVKTLTTLVNSFTDKRKQGEALGFIAPIGTASATVTTGTIATLASMGAATIATGPFAIPITVGLVAIGAIVGFYLRQKALNEELQGNLIAIKGEVERFYFIYKVIEQIAKEKNLNINTAMVRKFTILLTNNILVVAGPEVFALLKKAVNEDPHVLFTPETMGPLKSHESISAVEAARGKRGTILSYIFSPSVQRVLIPAELLRIIIRDVTILSIFFTILQSEFDLLLKEYDAKQKKELLSVLSTDSSLSESAKNAFQKYFKEESWLDSDEYFRFKCNLPFNNLNLQHTSAQELTGGLLLTEAAPLPSAPLPTNSESNTSNPNSPNQSGRSTPQQGGSRKSQTKRKSKTILSLDPKI